MSWFLAQPENMKYRYLDNREELRAEYARMYAEAERSRRMGKDNYTLETEISKTRAKQAARIHAAVEEKRYTDMRDALIEKASGILPHTVQERNRKQDLLFLRGFEKCSY